LASAQRESFAVFRTPPEGLPVVVTNLLRRPRYGANWKLAQRLSLNDRTAIWALPARRTICLVAWRRETGAATTCASTRAVLHHGVALTSLNDAQSGSPMPERTIVGIAPDDARLMIARSPGVACSIHVFGGLVLSHDNVGEPPDTFTILRREHPRSDVRATEAC